MRYFITTMNEYIILNVGRGYRDTTCYTHSNVYTSTVTICTYS